MTAFSDVVCSIALNFLPFFVLFLSPTGPAHSSSITTNTLNAYARTGSSSTSTSGINSSSSSSAVPSRPLATDYVYIDNLRSNTDMDVESALHRAEGGKDLNNDTIIPSNSAAGLTNGNTDTSPDSEAESLLSADHNTDLLMALEKGPMNSAIASSSSSIGGAGMNTKATVSENSSAGGGGGGIGWLKGVWGNSAVSAKERDK